MIHHYTLRTYTAMLLGLFNDIEVEYKLSDGTRKSKNIPIKFSTREKATIIDENTLEQLLSGNYNILPRSTLVLSGLGKNGARTTNKNLKINTVKSDDTYSYSYNSVPYMVNFELIVMCRGMNELTAIIEQVAPRFNPTMNIDVSDAQNLSEYSRIPVSLNEITWTDSPYDELSSNIFELTFALSVQGSLYPPIRDIHKIKEVKMFMSDVSNGIELRTITNWDVDDEGLLINEDRTTITDESELFPVVQGLVVDGAFTIGTNTLTGIYSDVDEVAGEAKFEFNVLRGGEYVDNIEVDNNILTFDVNDDTPKGTEVEVSFKVIDIDGNYDTIEKIYTI